jgi:peptide/nickel transport system substrate-binding protein
MRMPRYYAVFFNTSAHPALKEKNVRLALNYATGKSELIESVFDGKALAVDGPLVPGMDGYDPEVYPKEIFSIEKANNILNESGWLAQEDGVRAKTIKGEKIRLEFDLVVPEISFLEDSAKIISENWAKAGIKANIRKHSIEKINNETIRTRNYQMIIFGNIFSNNGVPDLSSFWHSSERFYPGLNLSLYENKTADSLIESDRKAVDPDRRQGSLSSLQSLIVQDSPGVFLFSPNYFYASKTSLGGFGEKFITLASKRFQNISGWYIKTARIFK